MLPIALLNKSIARAAVFAKRVFARSSLKEFDVVHIDFCGHGGTENGYIEYETESLLTR